MESLMKAVKKSPRPFSKPGASKHKKLSENWGEVKEPVKEGVSFYVKYLGSTLVEELDDGQSYGDAISSEAVKTIVNMAKMGGKKLPKMCITVSTNGIKVTNMITKEVKADISIYRICFCTADRNHDKVFAYIARNTDNETMECQAFLCPKRKIAQAVTLTVAQSFSTAQEDWEEKERKDRENQEKVYNALTEACVRAYRALSDSSDQFETVDVDKIKSKSGNTNSSGDGVSDFLDSPTQPMDTAPSLDDDFNPRQIAPPSSQKQQQQQQQEPLGFDDNFDDSFNVEDDFSSLAQSRSSQSNIQPPNFSSPGGFPETANPFSNFHTSGVRPEDLEDGVQDLLGGQRSGDELTRQPSIDDLLSL